MRISLITAVYNNSQGLISSLNSSFQQSYSQVERIIIDGASKDGTLSVLEQKASELDKVISEPDNGIYDALNKGIKLVNGDIVGILHSDDLFSEPTILEKVVEQFEKTSIDLLYGDLCYVRSDNPEKILRYWKSGSFVRTRLKQGWMPPHPTVYVRREIYERFGGYDTRYSIAADYDWMLRLLKDPSIKVCYLPEVMVYMGTGGISNRKLWQKSAEDYKIIRKNQIGGISTLILKNLIKIPQFINSK